MEKHNFVVGIDLTMFNFAYIFFFFFVHVQVDRVFRKYDLNQDGVITLEEFLEACLKDSLIIDSIQMFDTQAWNILYIRAVAE